jgi:hypothetical protein
LLDFFKRQSYYDIVMSNTEPTLLGNPFLNAVKIAFQLFISNPAFPNIYAIGGGNDGSLLLYIIDGADISDRDIKAIESVSIGEISIRVIQTKK